MYSELKWPKLHLKLSTDLYGRLKCFDLNIHQSGLVCDWNAQLFITGYTFLLLSPQIVSESPLVDVQMPGGNSRFDQQI